MNYLSKIRLKRLVIEVIESGEEYCVRSLMRSDDSHRGEDVVCLNRVAIGLGPAGEIEAMREAAAVMVQILDDVKQLDYGEYCAKHNLPVPPVGKVEVD